MCFGNIRFLWKFCGFIVHLYSYKLFLRLMVSKEAISLVAVWLHRTKQCHWVICLSANVPQIPHIIHR